VLIDSRQMPIYAKLLEHKSVLICRRVMCCCTTDTCDNRLRPGSWKTSK